MNLLLGSITSREIDLGSYRLLAKTAAPLEATRSSWGCARVVLDRARRRRLRCAQVKLIEPTGPDIYALLEADGQSLVARLPARATLPERQEVTFYVDMEKAVLFDSNSGDALFSGRSS